MSDHHRKLERMYLGAPINRFYMPRIVVREGECEVWCDARLAMHHAAGGVHGSVFFKMLDDAAFFAIASTVPDVLMLTASFHVSLFRPLTTGELHSRGRLVRGSQSLCVAEAVLFDPDGREAARGIGDFSRSRIGLGPDIGYA
ncbi:MAG: PaaI family thioesterase [Polyangiaceae bacterium]